MIAETRAFRGICALFAAMAGIAAMVGAGMTPAYGQGDGESDVSDIWYRGYMLNKLAEEKFEAGDYVRALSTYNQAEPLLRAVAEQYPTFHPEIVKKRIRLIRERQTEVRNLMREKSRPKNSDAPNVPKGPKPGETQDLNNGEFDGLPTWDDPAGNTPGPGTVPNPQRGNTPPQPRTQVAPPQGGGNQVQNPAPATIYPQGGSIVEQLVNQERQREQQIAWQNQQISALQQKVRDGDTRYEQLRVELNRSLSANQQIKAGAGSTTDSAEWGRIVDELTGMLDSANQRNSALIGELKASRKEVAALSQQIRDLKASRNSVINGNEGEGLRELVQQNEELRNQLEKIQKYAETVNGLDREKSKEIAMLKNELEAVNSKWQSVKELNETYQTRIEELQNKLTLFQNGLNSEEALLLADANPVVAAENDLLQGVVVKQLQRQAQRKMATDLLLAQLDKIGVRTESLDALIEDIATGAQFTDTQKNLFKGPEISELIADAESRALSYQPPTTPKVKIPTANGGVEEQKLGKELSQIQKSARLDFVEGRFLEAEQGYEQYLKYRPNNVPCLCNLALVNITVKRYDEAQEHLKKAIEIDGNSGAAHYLLGRTYFVQGRHDDALTSLETGLTHDPKNPKAHNCVGVIASQKGWVDRAEDSFNEAVKIDPDFGDAHFNLAVLFATRDDANALKTKEHYFKALHLGIPRDASIETFLKQQSVPSSSEPTDITPPRIPGPNLPTSGVSNVSVGMVH